MKAIMISIKPQYVEKILNGEKTIEIRKTMPKCELPCKVYIYCTKPRKWWRYSSCGYTSDELLWKTKDKIKMCDGFEFYYEIQDCIVINGKVVAEFTLNKIDKFDSAYSEWAYSVAPEDSEMPISETQFIQMAEQKGKLDCNDLLKYFGDEDYIAYAWHIDNLKVYDKPKELSEFSSISKRMKGKESRFSSHLLQRPPMSWCYVEELENE